MMRPVEKQRGLSPARPQKKSLSLLVLGTSVLTLGVILGAYASGAIMYETAQARRNLQIEAESIAEELSQKTRQALWNMDQNTAELILQIEAMKYATPWIVVKDDEGKIWLIIAKSAGSNTPAPQDPKNWVEPPNTQNIWEKAIEHRGVKLGTVRFSLDYQQRLDTHQKFIQGLIFNQVFVSIVLVLAILAMVRIFIIGRINALSSVVSAFDRDKLDQRLSPGRMDEIGVLTESFNNMADRLRNYSLYMEEQIKQRSAMLVESERLAFLGSLVAGISHELNTPLGIALTALGYTIDRQEDIKRKFNGDKMTKQDFESFLSDLEKSLQLMSGNISRAEAMVKNFKGIGADQLTDEPRLFGVKSYLEEIAFNLGPLIKRKNHHIVLAIDDKLQIFSVPGAFYQIFSNLMVNSVRHGFLSDQEGTITISAYKTEQAVHFIYRDDGRGISPEVLPRIFEAFFTTQQGNGGTGLGLTLVKSLTGKLGGTVTCTSSPGAGAVFEIILPLQLTRIDN